MARQRFFLGLLFGLVLGVGTSAMAFRTIGLSRPAPSVRSIRMPTVQVTNAPEYPSILQLPPGIPPGAVRREFNGQPYYIIPLSDVRVS